ncbi:thioredoxin family protein [Aureivirga sp. CE67]|uniref:thioredoxin family protein n=1 Tax=Aureivirga sp. CE67 TaxID=1788983 RepID=UPI0018CAD2CF|nr:thioredoxin family protein [Aureivirga sp. CE67]
MPAVESEMLALGTKAPNFHLLDTVSGKYLGLKDVQGEKGTFIFFICNHCPYVIHIIKKLVEISNEYQVKGISFVGISSNDVVNYPMDSPDKMTENAKENGFGFPYLYDNTQLIAKDYKAACTPDLFFFDENLELVYRGQFDDSRPGNGIAVTGKDLIHAFDAHLNGKKIDSNQTPSIGCSIKWK